MPANRHAAVKMVEACISTRCTWFPHAVHGMHAMYSVNIPRSVGY
jgi:hypothetical protein